MFCGYQKNSMHNDIVCFFSLSLTVDSGHRSRWFSDMSTFSKFSSSFSFVGQVRKEMCVSWFFLGFRVY